MPNTPTLPVRVRHVAQRKRATAQIREAAIDIVLPQHWPCSFQQEVAQELTQRLQRQFERDYQLVQSMPGPFLTFADKPTLQAWVFQLNRQTLGVPVQGARIGHAKYTHLAQMNLKTQVMTVSKHCLRDVPESALTYLVLHELAHLVVPNHSAAFWNEVRRFVPDVKHQRRVMAAFHRIRLYEAEAQARSLRPETPAVSPPGRPSALKQLVLDIFRLPSSS